MRIDSIFSNAPFVFISAILLRAILLVYGHYQDQNSALKYTDIDYYVFTDAARYVSRGQSPYMRDTYRYTPLLAWLLVPTTFGGLWFDFGKVIFAASDIVAGWLIFKVLRDFNNMDVTRALKFSSLWLLNPMVAQISTRGSSEGLLAVMVTALLWATLERRYVLAGALLGFSVHFKIYPFIYAFAIFLWIGDDHENGAESWSGGTSQVDRPNKSALTLKDLAISFITPRRVAVTLTSAATFAVLNLFMYFIYGHEFIHHTYLYHLTRTDHRHNFSVYNIWLYLNASPEYKSAFPLERWAFVPQLFLSAFAIPLVLARKDIASCMLIQTMAFVTFNKVCTSQYFLWYMVFLPFHFPSSSFLASSRKGVAALVLWIAGQAIWLEQGYELEFLGKSTFYPGLFWAAIVFFLINVWIMTVMITDVRLSKGIRAIIADKIQQKKAQ